MITKKATFTENNTYFSASQQTLQGTNSFIGYNREPVDGTYGAEQSIDTVNQYPNGKHKVY